MSRSTIAGSAAVLFLCIAALNFAAGRSDVADAAMKGDKATLRTLLQQKADVNALQVDGATALHWAVYRDDLEMTDLLIRAGAKEQRSEEHTSELQSLTNLVCRLLLEK